MNQITKTQLEQMGCDVKGAIGRLLDDEEMYGNLLISFVPTIDLDALEKAIGAADVKAAFECGHALKGVTGNLGLTPLYTPLCQMTEILRHGSLAGAADFLPELREEKKKLDAVLGL